MRKAILFSAIVGVTVAAAVSPHEAKALPGIGASGGILVGTGLKPGDYSEGSPNPYGLGLGVRGGINLMGLYGGATFVYHLGGSVDVLGQSVKTNVMYYGLEGGYEIGLGPIAVRPYVGLGNMSVKASVGSSSDSQSSLYVAPGIVGLVTVAGFFVGADVRYMYPFKKGTTANGGEISNASLGFFGTVGMSI
ncbi:MAG: hypothetical protein IPJ34_15790 [Myxococcales bacterium]|nr:hypothetical protein [Myxococcales bacterium]